MLQREVVKLLVQVYEQGGELVEQVECNRGIINKGPGFAIGTYFPADDALRFIIELRFCKCGFKNLVIADIKISFYYRFLIFINKHRGIGTLAENE